MHCKYYTYFFLRCILYVWRKSWTLPRFWPWSHRSGVRQQQRRLTMSSGDFVVYWGISVTHGWWPWSTKDGSRNIHIPQFRKDCWEYLGTSCSLLCSTAVQVPTSEELYRMQFYVRLQFILELKTLGQNLSVTERFLDCFHKALPWRI